MDSVVYIGAERVGKAVLEKLLEAGKNVTAVFTAHPDFKDRIADYVDFTDLESKYTEIDFQYVKNCNSPEIVNEIKNHHPSVILVISWSQIIHSGILDIPPGGVVGLHYSLLPQRRGGAPLNWAIIDGLKETGISLFYMTRAIDAGDIIAQKVIPMEFEDTVNDLLDKIKKIAPVMMLEHFDEIIRREVSPIRQDESRASYTRRRTAQDSEIDWAWDLDRIHKFIRALSLPYPAAFSKLGQHKLVFTSAKKVEDKVLKVEGYITGKNG